MSTRVVVVDDSSLFRRIVSDALSGLPGVEVVGTASNGKAGLEKIRSLHPDLVTLDIEMPEMNGLDVLERMRESGLKANVIVLSSLTAKGGEMTVRALEGGAFDFISKPDSFSPEEARNHLRATLKPILHTLERRREILHALRPRSANIPLPSGTAAVNRPVPAPKPGHRNGSPLVLIGVSTGGPAALAKVLPGFPAGLTAPVFIAQHMPPHFTDALARRLESIAAIRVKEAENGEIAKAGCAYIAPGGRQMKLARGPNSEVIVRINDDPPENDCRPSVDYLFRSVALSFAGRSVAAILTGMGNDGAQGLKMLKRGGGFNIAQDEASCVVFGMPREAILTGAVDAVVPLDRIAQTILRALQEVCS